MDFQCSPAAVIPAGQSSGVLADTEFDASRRYMLVLRPVIDGMETPDISCRFEFETDLSGDWLGQRPGAVEAVHAEVLPAGRISVSWSYRIPDLAPTIPEEFCVYHSTDPGIEAGEPQATVSYERDGVYSCTLSLVGGVSYFFVVTARSSEGVESHMSAVVGPVLADDSAPAQPSVVLTTF